MTTPERLRRRQRIESFFLVVLGLIVVVVAMVDSHQRETQAREIEACLIEEFSANADAQAARGEIAERQAALVAEVFTNVGVALTTGDIGAIEGILTAYKFEQDQIDQDRKDNPYPPFPQGVCD